MEAIVKTDFNFPGQTGHYVGKVRDVYSIGDDYLVMVVSDRISAFDVVLPKGIPFKGQVLNQIAAKFLDATTDILPNWKIATPDPMVTVGHKCEPFKVEMVIRGYLSGHAWREYKAGKRTICGVEMPEGMVENQKFPTPIITPTTKAAEGHDEDISKEEIIAQGIVSKEDYEQLEAYTQAIFQRGTEIAAKMGLILVDTNMSSVRRTDRSILWTRSTLLIHHVTSMQRVTRSVLQTATSRSSSQRSSFVSGLWRTASRVRTVSRFLR